MVPSPLAGDFVDGRISGDSPDVGAPIADFNQGLVGDFYSLGVFVPVAGAGLLSLAGDGDPAFVGVRSSTLDAHPFDRCAGLDLGRDA